MSTTRHRSSESTRSYEVGELGISRQHPDTAGSERDGTGFESAAYRWLGCYSITLLRISMGVVIFGFGALKYFPGVSPVENLVLTAAHVLTFGWIPGHVVMVLLATAECFIGLSLITGWGLNLIIYPLVAWAVGILSPVAVSPGRLFSGPDHAPTLEGQYVLKDIVLFTAGLVIAAAVRHKSTNRE